MNFTKEQVRETVEEYREMLFGLPFMNFTDKKPHEDFLKEKGLTDELEAGKWYKMGLSILNYKETIDGVINCYGLSAGIWYENITCGRSPEYFIEATPEEVEKALIEEAKRRGLNFQTRKLFTMLSAYDGEEVHHFIISNTMKFNSSLNRLYLDHVGIFSNGKWAEIVSEELTELKKKYKELGETIDKLESK